MRAYFKTASTFLLCVAGAALAGCFSAAVAPPAANAPCTSADGCPAGYQCRPATTGASGTFCCKDKSSCGPAGIDGSVRDATIGLDGAGGAGGIDVPALDVGTDTPIGAGGSGGMATDTSTGGDFATGGISGTGGTGAGGVDAPTIDSGVDAPIATGGTSAAGGVTGTGGVGTATGGTSAAGGTIGTGGIGVGGSGSGGQVTCSGSTKVCNGSCIPSTSCCGGCSGNTPVCSNGTCVGRAIGDTCSTGTECASAVCADGVCCNVVCNGQCESCSTVSSKGTCAPTTTPRTACTGTGVCGGICDGSATNRKTCVFPDDKTSCGASASCSAGKLNTAAVCNGSGTCNASSTSSCPYGCKTDGTVGCATSCPNGQGLCGGSCVDILSSNSNCGGCDKPCTGNLSCSGGTCKCPNTSSACGSSCTACGLGQVCSAGTCACPGGAAFICNACLSWDFEAGSTSGWSLGTRNDGTGTLQLATNAGRGNYSLVIQNAQFNQASSDLFVQVSFCSGVAVAIPANGFTFSVDVLFQSSGYGFGDDGTGAGFPGVVLEGNGFSHDIAPNTAPFANGTWYTWSWTFTGTSTATIDLRFAPQASWNGNIYLDNISIK